MMHTQSDSNDKEPLSLTYHPEFSSEEADVILAAKESTMYFRVHSFTLKSTSGFFNTMFSLPQYVFYGISYLHFLTRNL
jgi:hypothetical protein